MAHFTQKYHNRTYGDISPTLPALSQSGRSVLITGGGSGIGFSIAKSFITAGAARVIIASRTESKLIEATAQLRQLVKNSSTVIEHIVLDMSSDTSIAALWSSLKQQGVEIDVLILNAAELSTTVKLTEVESLEKLRGFYQVNVLGNWQMAAYFIAQGPKNGKVLINVSTVATHWVPAAHSVYGTTKAAFTHMLQGLSDEVPREDVQIISVHPGAVFTEPAAAAGYSADTIPWDHVDLPGEFMVWASSKQATLLHGRFVWANWDVKELMSLEQRIQDDVDFLRLGVNGVEHVDPIKLFQQVAELAKRDG